MVRLIETGNHRNGCDKWSISNEWRRSVWLDGHGWATNKMILLSNMRICALYAQNAMNQHRYRYMYSNEWIHHLFAHTSILHYLHIHSVYSYYMAYMAYMKLHKLHYSKTLYIFGGHESDFQWSRASTIWYPTSARDENWPLPAHERPAVSAAGMWMWIWFNMTFKDSGGHIFFRVKQEVTFF